MTRHALPLLLALALAAPPGPRRASHRYRLRVDVFRERIAAERIK